MRPAQTDAKRLKRLVRKVMGPGSDWATHTFHHLGRLFSLRSAGRARMTLSLTDGGQEITLAHGHATVPDVRRACEDLLVREVLDS